MTRKKILFPRIAGMTISRKILILVTFSVILLTLSTGIISYARMASALVTETSSKMHEVLKQININVSHSIEQQENEMQRFLTNLDSENFLLKEKIITGEDEIHLKNSIIKLKQNSDYLIDARLFTDFHVGESSVIYSKGLLQSHHDIPQLTEKPFVWTVVSDKTWNKFAYLPAIYCYTSTNENDIWRFDISADKIFQSVVVSNFGSNGTVLVAKDNGSLVYYSKNSEIVRNYRDVVNTFKNSNEISGYSSRRIGSQTYFISYTKNNALGWFIIGVVPMDEIQESAILLRGFIISSTIVLSAMLIAALNLILRIFTNRTKKLARIIERFGNGDFSVRFDTGEAADEISVIGQRCNDMMDNIEQYMREAKKHYERENILLNENLTLEIMRKQAEYQALQNQINPHFLFNTLEMIKGLFYEENSKEKIINVAQALSDMFRYNLRSSTVATLEQELNHVKDYMFIQNNRFDEAIRFVIDVPDNLLSVEVIRFILEPIVENSIKHGFIGKMIDKEIVINACEHERLLILSVGDNGKGIEPLMLERLNSQLRTSDNSENGIGLSNINARMKREYGEKYGLRFQSEEEQGTVVWICIPLGRNNDEVL